jgi:hypothetical protein
MVGFVIVSPYLADYAANVLSIFDSKAQDEVGGSNASMLNCCFPKSHGFHYFQ